MRTPRRILLHACSRASSEVMTQFGALIDAFPDAEVELYGPDELEASARMASPAAQFVFDDGTDLWLTGHLDDPAAVRRALAWSDTKDESTDA